MTMMNPNIPRPETAPTTRHVPVQLAPADLKTIWSVTVCERGNGASIIECTGPAEAVAAWMRALADRLAPATRVRYMGIHPTHEQGEADR